MRRSTCVLLGFTLLTGAACARDAATDAKKDVGDATVSDSAGVAIVQSGSPSWSGQSAWTIDTTAAVVLSPGAGGALSQVQSARRLSDGRIAVIDGATQELRLFDAQGRFVSVSGAVGEGEGQSRNLGALVVMPGDSLFAWDYRGGRGLVYDATGEFVRHVSATTTDTTIRQPRLALPLPDGSYVGIGASVTEISGAGVPARNGFWQTFARFDAKGAMVDTIRDFQIARCPGLQQDCATSPFSPVGLVAISQDRIYYGFSDTYDIRAYGLDGTLLHVIRRDVDAVPVPTSFVDSLRARWKSFVPPAQHGGLDRFIASQDFGTVMPLYRSLLADAEGNLWVGDITEPFQLHMVFSNDVNVVSRGPSNPVWSVFNRDGGYLGTLRAPRGFQVHDIGADYILGERVGDDGVENVVMYLLRKPG